MAEARLLGNRYELGDLLGHGGMAEVRRGVDQRLGRTVAIKTLRTDLATDPTFQKRFRREAQSAASLNHPSIVAVYDTGEELVDDVAVPYIVMEYVDGRTLREVLREGRRILPERALEITADVCEALEYSHRNGIIHRDIKPGNVMLTPSGDVKVMDFGIARAIADASGTMTQTAAVIGTAQYLSPEQARGESVDARSDIYSTGCLLYELLASRPPFVGDSPVSVAYQHVREEPRPPSMIDAEVPPEADAITLKALAKRADDRYQSAGEMRADIQRALAGQQLTVPVTPVDATARYLPPSDAPDATPTAYDEQDAEEEDPHRRRRIVMYVLLAVAVLLLFAGAAWAGTLFFSSNPDKALAPDLQGKTVEEARVALAQKGLRLGTQTKKASEDAPSGVIFAQDPEAGQGLKPKGKVDVTVSTGNPKRAIPGVIGEDVNDAQRTLEDAGFRVTTAADRSSDEDEDTVTHTDPQGGKVRRTGTTVTVYYSAGLATVPNVRGMDVSEAKARLDAEGFSAQTVTQETGDADPGTVLSQDPHGGQRKESGSTVNLVVAKAPPEQNPGPTPTNGGPAPTGSPTSGPTGSPSPTESPTSSPGPTSTTERSSSPTPTPTGPSVPDILPTPQPTTPQPTTAPPAAPPATQPATQPAAPKP